MSGRGFGAKLRASRDRWDSVARTFRPAKQQFVPLAKMCIERQASDPILPTLLRHRTCHVLRSDGWILQQRVSYWRDEFNPGRTTTSGQGYKRWKRLLKDVDPMAYVEKFKRLRLEKGWAEDTRGM